MELGAVVWWVVVAVSCVICVVMRARHACLQAHTKSLRDFGEHKYESVHQSAA